jgi:formyl-CoA transferase
VSSVTGGPDGPARVGVSIVDVAAGLNAYEAILEALIARSKTNQGAEISVSMFDAMAEWMTVPLLHGEGGAPFKRIGLAHAAIAPYGVFKSRDGADVLIAIQNDREWRVLAEKVLGDAALGGDPKFATNPKRVENRRETDARVTAAFAKHDVAALIKKLEAADIAFARVNDWELLSKHPHLRRITVGAPSGSVSTPAPAPLCSGEERSYGAIPALGEHTELIRREFFK